MAGDDETDTNDAAKAGEDDEEDEEDLEKLQAEIARMEAEAARITKETEQLQKKKDGLEGGGSSGGGKSGSGGAGSNSTEQQASRDGLSIYVGQVDYTTTPEELLSHFQPCGTVERVTIVCDKMTGRPKGFAYLEFQNDDAVELAIKLDGSEFKGRSLKGRLHLVTRTDEGAVTPCLVCSPPFYLSVCLPVCDRGPFIVTSDTQTREYCRLQSSCRWTWAW
jgi:polyadenylate-binding protein 2